MTSSLGRDFLCAQRHVVDANIIDQTEEEGAGAHHQQPVYWRIAGRAGKNQWRRRPQNHLDLPFIAGIMKEVWPGGVAEVFECDIPNQHDFEDTCLAGRL